MVEQNGQKGGPHENKFQIQKWMLQTGKRKKVDEKIGVIPVVSMLSSRNVFVFVLNSARNLSTLKQFTYMHLKVLVMHFQKIVLFIILWLDVSEILGFEIEELC